MILYRTECRTKSKSSRDVPGCTICSLVDDSWYLRVTSSESLEERAWWRGNIRQTQATSGRLFRSVQLLVEWPLLACLAFYEGNTGEPPGEPHILSTHANNNARRSEGHLVHPLHCSRYPADFVVLKVSLGVRHCLRFQTNLSWLYSPNLGNWKVWWKDVNSQLWFAFAVNFFEPKGSSASKESDTKWPLHLSGARKRETQWARPETSPVKRDR